MVLLELTDFQALNLQRYLSHLSFGASGKLYLDLIAGQLSQHTKKTPKDIELIPFKVLYDDEEQDPGKYPTFHLD